MIKARKFTLFEEIVILDESIPPKAIAKYFNRSSASVSNKRRELKSNRNISSNRQRKNFTEYEISVINDPNISLEEKAILLDRNTRSIRSKINVLKKGGK